MRDIEVIRADWMGTQGNYDNLDAYLVVYTINK